MKQIAWIIAATIGLAAPAFAYASDAFVTADVRLVAGPDTGYPQVDVLESGSQVSIQGCTTGWEWCDVIAYGERGWVPGNYLEVDYQNQWVLVPAYAPRIGVPIVVFSFNNYWDSYYRGRPFYGQRWSWNRRPPMPYHPAPRPIDVPPPHPIAGPPIQHHPLPWGRVAPLPHPVPDAQLRRNDTQRPSSNDRDAPEQNQQR